jgi:hypothetical protein
VESLYNLGRAHHALKINDLARLYYLKALEASETEEGQQCEKLDLLVSHAAFNLCVIYEEAGAHASAEEIRQRYLTL